MENLKTNLPSSASFVFKNDLSNVVLGNATVDSDGTFVKKDTLEKLKERAYQLCLAIERLPIRETMYDNVQQTSLSIQASDLHQELQKLVYPHLYK